METMYTPQRLSEIAMQNARDIAELKSNVNSAHRRIDENDRLTEGIHQLAENVATMSVEVKMLTEKVDTNIEEMKSDLKEQSTRITAIESEPAKKWDKLIWLIIGGIVTVVISFFAGRLL